MFFKYLRENAGKRNRRILSLMGPEEAMNYEWSQKSHNTVPLKIKSVSIGWFV